VDVSLGVLFVCTGNVCRSPMGERLLRARLAGTNGASVRTSSAGTRALVGSSMDGPSAAVLRDLGGDPDGHAARQLVPEMIMQADLVLASDSVNRGNIVRATPLAMRHVFTMREFARLGSGCGPLRQPTTDDAVRARIAEIAAQRGAVEPAAPGEDEIGDPFGAPLPFVQLCGEQVRLAVDGIVSSLGL
jgi:protein-tyrosine phosphatase